MRSLDASFCFDLLRGDVHAGNRAREWEATGESLSIAAPVYAEFLRAGYRRGGRFLERSLAFVSQLEMLSIDGAVADEAARLGAECDHRGTSLANTDLLIAAVVRRHGGTLVTRDGDFARVPGLQVETY
jgi:predicted nucleic acid-binding protein